MRVFSRILIAAMAIGLVGPAFAQGTWRPVKDDVGFFSADAERQANQKVAELKKLYNKDLFIEVPKPPTPPAGLDVHDQAAKQKFFDHFAEKRFTELHENGVYVLIVPEAKAVSVVVGNNTRDNGYFTNEDRDKLVHLIRDRLRQKDHDGALLTAADFVLDTMKLHHPHVKQKAEVAPVGRHDIAHDNDGGVHRGGGFPWGTLITIGAVILGVWVLFAVVRALFAGSGGGMAPAMGGAPGYGYGAPGGGGGFFSNFLGGMFGAAAGMWVYNSFFGHGTSSAFGGGWGDHGTTNVGDAGSSPDSGPADTSGSASGASYGDDNAGGSDWGGGDAGGGDAGGGDAGGGDWGGGGGGDWGGGGGGDWGGGGGGDW